MREEQIVSLRGTLEWLLAKKEVVAYGYIVWTWKEVGNIKLVEVNR